MTTKAWCDIKQITKEDAVRIRAILEFIPESRMLFVTGYIPHGFSSLELSDMAAHANKGMAEPLFNQNFFGLQMLRFTAESVWPLLGPDNFKQAISDYLKAIGCKGESYVPEHFDFWYDFFERHNLFGTYVPRDKWLTHDRAFGLNALTIYRKPMYPMPQAVFLFALGAEKVISEPYRKTLSYDQRRIAEGYGDPSSETLTKAEEKFLRSATICN